MGERGGLEAAVGVVGVVGMRFVSYVRTHPNVMSIAAVGLRRHVN